HDDHRRQVESAKHRQALAYRLEHRLGQLEHQRHDGVVAVAADKAQDHADEDQDQHHHQGEADEVGHGDQHQSAKRGHAGKHGEDQHALEQEQGPGQHDSGNIQATPGGDDLAQRHQQRIARLVQELANWIMEIGAYQLQQDAQDEQANEDAEDELDQDLRGIGEIGHGRLPQSSSRDISAPRAVAASTARATSSR